MEQLTVEALLEILQKLVKENPAAKTWKINHEEFGGVTPSYNVSINEKEKELCLYQ